MVLKEGKQSFEISTELYFYEKKLLEGEIIWYGKSEKSRFR